MVERPLEEGIAEGTVTHTAGGRTADEIVERAEAIQERQYLEWRSQLPQTPQSQTETHQSGPLRRVYEFVRDHPLGLYSELLHAADGKCDFKDQK